VGLKRRLEGVSKLGKKKKVASAGFVELIASCPFGSPAYVLVAYVLVASI
jgi:hypothetical protein